MWQFRPINTNSKEVPKFDWERTSVQNCSQLGHFSLYWREEHNPYDARKCEQSYYPAGFVKAVPAALSIGRHHQAVQ
jgi:hypothetical protein